jgi:hypothetical protein
MTYDIPSLSRVGTAAATVRSGSSKSVAPCSDGNVHTGSTGSSNGAYEVDE